MSKIKFRFKREFWQKFWALIAVCLIVLATAFWRSWQLNEQALFKADQARDAFSAQNVQEHGWKQAKLLGPKAGAAVKLNNIKGAFKLGPFYNYEQYLSVLFTGQLDAKHLLWPDRFLSLLSIILFYFFLRFFFNRKISLSVTILFAGSYFLTLYSRFAWNINQTVFWELLFAISLLKILQLNNQDKEKSPNRLTKWFLLLIFSFGVLGQLHLLNIFAFSFIGLATWLIYRPRLPRSAYFWGLLLLLILYSPMLISDYYNHGDNIKRFFLASQQEKKSRLNFWQAFNKVSYYHGKNYLLILTAFNKYDYKKIAILGDWFIILSLILIRLALFRKRLLGISRLPKGLVRQINKMFKLNKQQKQFLIIISLWFFIFFLLYWRILPRLGKHRYWLMVSPLPFIFLAFWFYVLDRLGSGEYKFWNRYITNSLIILISGLILFSNLDATQAFYRSLQTGEKTPGLWHQRPTLGPYSGFYTYGRLKRIGDYLKKETSKENKPAICFADFEYQTKGGLKFVLEKYHPQTPYLQTLAGEKYDCAFFAISKSSRGKDSLSKIQGDYFIEKPQKFESLAVWKLIPINEKTNKQKVEKKEETKTSDPRVIFWEDVFNKKQKND